MTYYKELYSLEENHTQTDLKFYFVSTGAQNIVKAIHYQFFQKFEMENEHILNGRNLFNLGFGDYDISSDTIYDDINSNNGDVRKVFYTVLSTIPSFFELLEGNVIMVQGSDGRPEFVENCKASCTKKCEGDCKNFNRRINIYKNFVDRHFTTLSVDYQFFGGNKAQNSNISIEDYVPYKNYDSVFLIKK